MELTCDKPATCFCWDCVELVVCRGHLGVALDQEQFAAFRALEKRMGDLRAKLPPGFLERLLEASDSERPRLLDGLTPAEREALGLHTD